MGSTPRSRRTSISTTHRPPASSPNPDIAMDGKSFGDTLPPPPSTLKPVAPYVQRADELRAKDSIMAYWCMYYAAQLGLDLKSHEPGSRDYLLALITLLEKLKQDLGANDAIDHEAAGAAYVENFALKVFSLADREDREGKATRSTAKKFLAAANFLELLKVFEKTNNAQVNEEKVRYAKWKATDIAKAFREGRKPTPGPAGSEVAPDDATPKGDGTPRGPPGDDLVLDVSVTGAAEDSGPKTPPRKPKVLNLGNELGPHGPNSPGSWSTVATPGSEAAGPSSYSARLAVQGAHNRWKIQEEGDESPTKAGFGDVNASAPGSDPIDIPSRRVRFTPSVIGGLSSIDGGSPTRQSSISPPQSAFAQPSRRAAGSLDPYSAPLPESSPSGSSRTSLESGPPPIMRPVVDTYSISEPRRVGPEPGSSHSSPPSSELSRGYGRRTSVSSRTSPRSNGTSQLYPSETPFPPPATAPSAPPYIPGLPTASPAFPPPPPVPQRVNFASPPPAVPSPYNPPAPGPTAPIELTPAVIAKAQKHCRYAISSLEYEDAAQARKELRAALAVLGEQL